MATKAEKAAQKAEQCEALRGMLPRGSEVVTVLCAVSASGMTRRVKILVINGGEIECISKRVAWALGYRHDERHGAVIVSGCGMDMGYHIVHNLARALYPEVGARSGYELRHRWV
jgi:hypothetical protein